MVLFVSYSGVIGGAERHLVDVAAALEGERIVACPEGPLADAARAAELRVLPLHDRSLRVRGNALRAVARLAAHALEARALIRRLDPELVVAWGMRPALALLGRPRVAYHHHERWPGPLIGRLVRVAAGRAELVVTTSRHAARELDPRGRLGTRLTVVPPGIDAQRFAGIGPPSRPGEVLVLGALVPWKRPELALEAVALARRRLPALRVRFAGAELEPGAAHLTERLRARAAELGISEAVELAGPVDAPAALARAECLLHCAEREPYGLAVLEALAAGRPVVAPDDGGPAEIVDGSGRLFAAGDAQAAAAELVAVLGDPAEAARLSAAGRARARAQFDRVAADERYRALFDTAGEPPDAAELALVTVTHNSAPEVSALLASVARHLPGARVVVVDCGSRDESVEVAWRGGADVLALEENVGFGRACNRALAAVAEPVTALVNPDVELLDGSLLTLARAAREDRVLAPLVLRPDGIVEASVHPAPTSAADLARVLLPARLRTPRRRRRVGWAVGCCLVAPTATLRELGPFDERIFLFGEDMDLGLRARERGIETWLEPSARVLHHGAHSTREAFGGEPFAALARARHDVVERRLGRARARLDDAAQAATFASRIVVKRALGRPAARERAQLAAVGRR
jgi:glycosyltransferase involved in cell wall biosynthesis/GT2 family glycosyltransferase